MRHVRQCLRVTLCVIATAHFHFTHATIGQPGTLDPNWAASSPFGAGKAVTPVGAGADVANAVTLQPDGKVLLAGHCYNGYNQSFCAVRFNASGMLDTSFNGTGTVITPISNGDYATAITLQPDGKVLLAGYCYNLSSFADFCALRYNANGTLDTSFGGTGTGKVITPMGSVDSVATAIALQLDGRVLLAGYCGEIEDYDFCALRYNANGTLDMSFNGTGKVRSPMSAGRDFANAVTLQPDGKMLLGGICWNGANNDFCALRYNANGTLDISFNGTGKVITPIGSGQEYGAAMVVQPDGKVLLAGDCSGNFCALRYNPNGTLDTGFNSTGTVTTSVGSGYGVRTRAIALQPDGMVMLAGSCFRGSYWEFCALRYSANGVLDTSFNNTGTVVTPIGSGNGYANAMALQPDGKLIVAGYCGNSPATDFCALRYDGGPNTPKTLTEYVYNPLNYYFLTSRDTDKSLLDATPGWARTGQSFSSLSFADPGSMGINRYYFGQVAKNQTRGSHFYTLVDSEKTALAGLNPTNQPLPRLPYNEGIDSYAFLPVVEGVGGRCAAGQTPVYRAFRGQSRFPDDPNHRFTTSLTLYNQLVAQGWDGEGVKMCAPN